jgi:hypothetical protein
MKVMRRGDAGVRRGRAQICGRRAGFSPIHSPEHDTLSAWLCQQMDLFLACNRFHPGRLSVAVGPTPERIREDEGNSDGAMEGD